MARSSWLVSYRYVYNQVCLEETGNLSLSLYLSPLYCVCVLCVCIWECICMVCVCVCI